MEVLEPKSPSGLSLIDVTLPHHHMLANETQP